MSDFLQEKKQEMEARMEELKPLIDEYHRLDAAARALDGVGRAPSSAASTPRRSSGGAGRPKGSGSRAKDALQTIKARPGITIPELAEAMDMSQANYLYRVTGELQKDGLIRKEGRGWHALQAA